MFYLVALLRGGEVASGRFCGDSLGALVFLSGFLALPEALAVDTQTLFRTPLAEQAPFVKRASYFCFL